MISVIELFNELNSHNCMSCNSRGIHDMTDTDVIIDCHYAGDGKNLRFIVVASTLKGGCLINETFDPTDQVGLTLTSEILCYDPCEEENFYSHFDISEEE